MGLEWRTRRGTAGHNIGLFVSYFNIESDVQYWCSFENI